MIDCNIRWGFGVDEVMQREWLLLYMWWLEFKGTDPCVTIPSHLNYNKWNLVGWLVGTGLWKLLANLAKKDKPIITYVSIVSHNMRCIYVAKHFVPLSQALKLPCKLQQARKLALINPATFTVQYTNGGDTNQHSSHNCNISALIDHKGAIKFIQALSQSSVILRCLLTEYLEILRMGMMVLCNTNTLLFCHKLSCFFKELPWKN